MLVWTCISQLSHLQKSTFDRYMVSQLFYFASVHLMLRIEQLHNYPCSNHLRLREYYLFCAKKHLLKHYSLLWNRSMLGIVMFGVLWNICQLCHQKPLAKCTSFILFYDALSLVARENNIDSLNRLCDIDYFQIFRLGFDRNAFRGSLVSASIS